MFRLATFVFFCISSIAAFAEAPTTAPAESDDMVALFNGEDLEGWDGDPRLWSVRDGVIHGETTKEVPTKGNTFLIWKDEVEDFELRLSFRCSATNNSGIQYRSQRVDKASNKWVVRGYQHEIRNEEDFPNVPSFIYDEKGSRGRICLVGQEAVWNEDGRKILRDDLISADDFKRIDESRRMERSSHHRQRQQHSALPQRTTRPEFHGQPSHEVVFQRRRCPTTAWRKTNVC